MSVRQTAIILNSFRQRIFTALYSNQRMCLFNRLWQDSCNATRPAFLIPACGGELQQGSMLKKACEYYDIDRKIQLDSCALSFSVCGWARWAITTDRIVKLGAMPKACEQKHDLEAAAIATETGTSASTFCRVKQGNSPNARGRATIINGMTQEVCSSILSDRFRLS